MAMTLDHARTAVLSLDVQTPVMSFVPGSDSIVPAAAKVMQAARKAGVLTMHVGLGFEPGYPEISPLNTRFSMLKERGIFIKGSDTSAIHPDVYTPGELVVYKHRVGAFSGNALEMILRAHRIENLVLFGIATSGIVLSTVRLASDLDFKCVVVKDACFDSDPEVHRVLTEKVFAAQASVVQAEQFATEL